jgi:hypothetical protein
MPDLFPARTVPPAETYVGYVSVNGQPFARVCTAVTAVVCQRLVLEHPTPPGLPVERLVLHHTKPPPVVKRRRVKR